MFSWAGALKGVELRVALSGGLSRDRKERVRNCLGLKLRRTGVCLERQCGSDNQDARIRCKSDHMSIRFGGSWRKSGGYLG